MAHAECEGCNFEMLQNMQYKVYIHMMYKVSIGYMYVLIAIVKTRNLWQHPVAQSLVVALYGGVVCIVYI